MRLAYGALLVGLMLLGEPASGRDLGDFGRVADTAANSIVAPLLEDAGNPLALVPDVLTADDELRMRDLLFRFFVPPYAEDRATPVRPAADRPERERRTESYARWLRGLRVESAATRYRILGNHLLADLDLLPRVFSAVCDVERLDGQRAVGARAIQSLSDIDRARIDRRRTANAGAIAAFARRLDERAAAYQFALDLLLAETPMPEARTIDQLIARLSARAGDANAGYFCGPPHTTAAAPPAPRALLTLPPLK